MTCQCASSLKVMLLKVNCMCKATGKQACPFKTSSLSKIEHAMNFNQLKCISLSPLPPPPHRFEPPCYDSSPELSLITNICQRVVCAQHFEDVLTNPPLALPAAAAPVDIQGGHSLHSFINCYQMMFFTLFALLAGTAIVIIGGSSHFYSCFQLCLVICLMELHNLILADGKQFFLLTQFLLI